MEDNTTNETRADLSALKEAVSAVKNEISKIIIGQEDMVNLILTALLADGHALIEGVPGIAKTLAAKLTAASVKTGYSRIQFTPDLMPSDVLGTSVFNMKNSDFEFKQGPVFSNIILIDEINRAPAKTQAALFEVMEERQITIDGNTYHLKNPFMVIATQNPVEHEGVYKLPEAQLDRFLFKITVGYPSIEQEETILNQFHQRRHVKEVSQIKPVLSEEQIAELQAQITELHVEPHLIKYIAQIVAQTRNNPSLFLGGSPRASLAILSGSKAFAAINGRDFVTPEDIQFIAVPALMHRLLLTPEKEMEGIDTVSVIRDILGKIEVPR